MASGRMLKTSIAKDKRLNDLSIEAEYLYLKAIPHLDRDGLMHGDMHVFCGTVCPRRFQHFAERFEAIVKEWQLQGLVLRYSSDEGEVLYFAGFQKNQSIRYDREGESMFPAPPGYVRTPAGLVKRTEKTNSNGTVPQGSSGSDKQGKDNAGSTPGVIQEYSGTTPPQSNLNEVKEKVIGGGSTDVPNGQVEPSFSSSGNHLQEMMDVAKRKDENRRNGKPVYREQAQIAEWNSACPFQTRTPIANAIADATGKRTLMDVGNQQILTQSHEAAIQAHSMGYTAERVTALIPAWKETFHGKNNGSIQQFLEFLSKSVSLPPAPLAPKPLVMGAVTDNPFTLH